MKNSFLINNDFSFKRLVEYSRRAKYPFSFTNKKDEI